MKISELLQESQLVQEIGTMVKYGWTGGKKYLSHAKPPEKLYPLPGNSGYLYSIKNLPNPIINIWDPNKQVSLVGPEPVKDRYELHYEFLLRHAKWEERQLQSKETGAKTMPMPIAELTLNEEPFPLPGALQVEIITVDEDYRNKGLAKALYQIVLTTMKRPLVAGSGQTPGGNRNWVALSSMPGVEVYGYVKLYGKRLDKNIDTIMTELGGDYMGQAGRDHYFRFHVRPNTTGERLTAYVQNNVSKVYGNVRGGLYAVWTGR